MVGNRARVSPRLPPRCALGQPSFESLTGAGVVLPARHTHGCASRPRTHWLLLSTRASPPVAHRAVASALRARSPCNLILGVVSRHHLQAEVRHRILPILREEVTLEVPMTSGGRGHSCRGKLHRGGVLCIGSRRVSRSCQAAIIGSCPGCCDRSVQLLGDPRHGPCPRQA